MSELIYRIAKTTEFVEMRVRITKKGQEHLDHCQKANLCLGCETQLIDGEKVRRGLCSTCYQAARDAIARDPSVEEDLLKSGQLLVRQKGGRPASNKFTQQLAKRAV